MKVNKLITLDIGIVEELKRVENASKLINGMLYDYFYEGGGLKESELKSKIKLLEKEIFDRKTQIEGVKFKIKEINEKDKEVKKIFKAIPDIVLRDFKAFPKMTEEILETRFKEIYSKYSNIVWKDVSEAFKQYFKKDGEALQKM